METGAGFFFAFTPGSCCRPMESHPCPTQGSFFVFGHKAATSHSRSACHSSSSGVPNLGGPPDSQSPGQVHDADEQKTVKSARPRTLQVD